LSRTLVAITGASSGIGEAFARKLAPEHDLLLIARRADRLEQLAADLRERYGTNVEPMTADLTRPEDVERVAQRLAEDSRLALLINNAGFGTGGYFWKAPLEPQEAMHQLHIMAPLRLTHAALRAMVARDMGAVINVASVAAFIRRPGSVSYGASKTWMTTFTEALYAELRQRRSQVTVQALCPGYTYSEFHDKMGVNRMSIAGKAFWHSAEFVVDASLDGLRRRKLFVIPGWRYRILTSFLNALPAAVRVGIETRIGGGKTRPFSLHSPKDNEQIASGQ